MGAIFTMALARVSDIGDLPGVRIALDASAEESLQGPLAESDVTLLIGAERHGLPEEVLAASDRSPASRLPRSRSTPRWRQLWRCTR